MFFFVVKHLYFACHSPPTRAGGRTPVPTSREGGAHATYENLLLFNVFNCLHKTKPGYATESCS